MPIVLSASVTRPGGSSSVFTCPLCCEEKPSSSVCVLSNCSHKSCRACCVKWIKKAEASGVHSLPTCPWCRVSMTAKETQNFLGRPFRPKTHSAAAVGAADIDELTLQWIRERTRQCPGCGVYIERLAGCDAMECLCGFQFCWMCGAGRGDCTCLGRGAQYYDNVLHRHTTATPTITATNARTGRVDFRRCIRIREQIGAGEAIRMARGEHYRVQQHEIEGLDQPTSTSPWLFCRTRGSVLKLIEQIGQINDVRLKRGIRKLQRERKELDQIELMLKEIEQLDHLTTSSPWIFCRTRESSLKKLNQIFQQDHVAQIRKVTLQERTKETTRLLDEMMLEIQEHHDQSLDRPLFSAPWLFHKHGLKVLNQITQTANIRRIRGLTIHEKAEEEAQNAGGYGARWLFGSKGWQWMMIASARGFYEERRKGTMYHKSISSYVLDR